MGINPSNGDIFALEAGGYTANGTVHIYTNEGTLVKSFETGIGPTSLVLY
ncbi:MAG: hypothetical protein U0T82_17205 [Bacteroidales bacterium]